MSLGSNGWFVMLKDGLNFDQKEGGCCFSNVPRQISSSPTLREVTKTNCGDCKGSVPAKCIN